MGRVGRYLAILLLAVTLGGESAARSPGQAVDVRVVVDISGSMKTNDPANLRQPAVRLLARLIPEGATAGVWTFGQYVNMLVPHGEVDDAWRQRAIERSRDINSVALRTNLGEALEVAGESYYSGGSLDATHFILLTDGQVDISEQADVNSRERQRILGEVLASFEGSGATVHTVALSNKADLALLESFADKTGGSYNLAENAEALNRVFLRALNAAVPQEQLPIEGNRFLVDRGVKEFTALIFPGANIDSADATALALVDPEGNTSNANNPGQGVRWVHEPGYDLITISAPQPGEWRLQGDLGQGSRVTVVSDLSLVVSPLPPRFRQGESVELEAWFEEQEALITNPDFLGVIDVKLTLTAADGRSGAKTLSPTEPPADGIYRDEIARLPSEGDYELELVADGQTFTRKFSQVLTYVVPEADGVEPAEESPVGLLEEGVDEAPGEGSQDLPENIAEPVSEPEEQTDAVPAGGPIDISAVELPEPSGAAQRDAERDWTPYLVSAGAVVGLILVGGGLWFWRSRRRGTGEPKPADSPHTTAEEPEPSPEEVVEDVEAEAAPEDTPEPEPEPEDAPEDLPQAPAAVAESQEEEEFGLEDFDLSEIEDLDEPARDSQGAAPEHPEQDAEQESADEKR